ncbi:hypothetical protein OHC33_004651 [Knufia fluminis]|uniref:Phospholipase D/nuclease n=1 Tax=Knufia fluminis TaxID=191047 RepID=A0AAN8I9B0_9EURO|nr:hypothetical protein OHC33_004651 [Knufia fluminis]
MSGVIDLTSDDKDKAQQSPVQLGSDGELDDNLKLAIAMSLQSQQSPTKPASAAAEATTDDSDGEVEKAIALSLQHEEGSTAAPTRSGQPQGKHEQTSTQVLSVSSTGGILGLDRKAMEAERLARLKRKRGPEPRSSSPPAKRISPPPLRRDRTATTTAAFPLSTKPHATSKSRSTNPFSFTTPRVLLTSHPSRHASHGLAAISLRDAISPPTPNLTLKSVLASSFIIDFDWLLPHFNTATTKFIFVLHAQNDQHRALLQRDFSGVPNVRLVMPECLGGGGNMHSKLLLLFFQGEKGGSGGEEVCRVVVPSANLIAADWGVGGVMENVLFVVDSPLKSTTEISDGETQFKREIKKQLREMGVADDVLRKLDKFDFGATKDVGFVHSMSGSRLLQSESGSLPKQKSFFASKSATTRKDALPNIPEEAQQHPSTPTQNDITRTGLLSLHDTIQSLNLSVSPTDPSYPPDLDFITSSLGNLATPFIRQLYQAACGHLDPTSIASSTARKRGKPAPNTDTTLDSLIKQNLRIYFPTSETVAKSKGGPNQAGTICFQKKWWETNESIRDVLCDCVGVRDDGILMHSKILYVRFKQPKAVQGADRETKWYGGWAYVGSGNLSESAWGRVVSHSKSKQPKMTCRNWESGVVIPVPLERAAASGEQSKMDTPIKAGYSTNGAGANGDRSPAVDGGQEATESATLRSLSEVFADVLPVPIHYPAQKHAVQQKRPWFFMN